MIYSDMTLKFFGLTLMPQLKAKVQQKMFLNTAGLVF